MTINKMEQHTFVIGKFKAGERGHQMPDETCDICGRDPRNMIHDTGHTLTDEELLQVAGEHARLTKLNERAYVLPETIELARLASAAAAEAIAARHRERDGTDGNQVRALDKRLMSEMKPSWETICEEPDAHVRRLPVTGGWLYQVQTGKDWKDFTKQTTKPIYGETTFVPGERARTT